MPPNALYFQQCRYPYVMSCIRSSRDYINISSCDTKKSPWREGLELEMVNILLKPPTPPPGASNELVLAKLYGAYPQRHKVWGVLPLFTPLIRGTQQFSG